MTSAPIITPSMYEDIVIGPMDTFLHISCHSELIVDSELTSGLWKVDSLTRGRRHRRVLVPRHAREGHFEVHEGVLEHDPGAVYVKETHAQCQNNKFVHALLRSNLHLESITSRFASSQGGPAPWTHGQRFAPTFLRAPA